MAEELARQSAPLLAEVQQLRNENNQLNQRLSAVEQRPTPARGSSPTRAGAIASASSQQQQHLVFDPRIIGEPDQFSRVREVGAQGAKNGTSWQEWVPVVRSYCAAMYPGL